jgi:hypothetical protein
MNKSDDLWLALCALAEGKKPKKTSPKALPLESSPIPSSGWHETEAILIIHEANCQVCDHTYTWPNPHLLIKKVHRRLGTHYVQAPETPFDPELVYAHLPLRTEYQFGSIQCCNQCFNLNHLIGKARLSALTEDQSNEPN